MTTCSEAGESTVESLRRRVVLEQETWTSLRIMSFIDVSSVCQGKGCLGSVGFMVVFMLNDLLSVIR